MRTHRFYSGKIELEREFWLHDERLINQWTRVLRFQPGQDVVLFNGETAERLYKINAFEKDGVKLELVTDYERRVPSRDVYLFWSLLKNDHNDLILEKATELGVSHFIPVIAERCVKSGFNYERAERIVIEASEQCGRSDIPKIREPIALKDAVGEYSGRIPLLVTQMGGEEISAIGITDTVGVFIGPEGGWTDTELQLFAAKEVRRVRLAAFTLRGETAAIAAATLFGQNTATVVE